MRKRERERERVRALRLGREGKEPILSVAHLWSRYMGTPANTLALMERLYKCLKSGSKADYREFSTACIHLSRLIDMAVVKNQKLPTLQDLTQLLKKVCEHKDNVRFQPAIMVLLLSVKNAICLGWFTATEKQELLLMSKELLGYFAGTGGWNAVDVGDAFQVISTIIPRFFPRLKLQTVVVALEAKPGYETMVCDFYVLKKPSATEQLRLFVIRKDSTDSSACLVTPPHVNFLVNGKGVEKRNVASMDTGPQMPTDVTGMLKIGTNLMQIVGEFPGTYMIAIALTGAAADLGCPLSLQIYSLDTIMDSRLDDELIEGPSRVSLRCPISHKRITTPVKGSSCKHHQCFDYDTFMEINCRRPAWRCPYCNTHISFPDLRLDLQMMKVLREVQDSVVDVMISGDGCWQTLEPEDTANVTMCGSQMYRKKNLGLMRNQEGSPEEGEFFPEQPKSRIIDLSDDDEPQRENCGGNTKGVRSFGAVIRPVYGEMEDRKPDLRDINATASESLMNVQTNVQMNTSRTSRTVSTTSDSARLLEVSGSLSAVGSFAPIVTDASIPAVQMGQLEPGRDENHVATSRFDFLGPAPSVTIGNNDLNTLYPMQALVPEGAGSGAVVMSECLSERQLNRESNRSPIAIQGLPAQTQHSNPNLRSRPHANSRPNSPAQPSNNSNASITSSSHFMGSQRSPQIVLPNFGVNVSPREGQVQLLHTGHQQLQQDNLSTLEIEHPVQTQQLQNVQTQSSEGVELREHRQRLIQQLQPPRSTQPLLQPDQRLSMDHQHISAGRNINPLRTEHQNVQPQQASFQQSTRQEAHNSVDNQIWQQVRFSAPQLQLQQFQQIQQFQQLQQLHQAQQAHLNLGFNSNAAHREENFSPGFIVAEGIPVFNQSPTVPAAMVGPGRRQPSQGVRSNASQVHQSSNNPFIIPNAVAPRDQRWTGSSDVAAGQMSDMAAMLLTEQSQRPVARMRGSISTAGRAAAPSISPNPSQGLPGNYGWLYGVSSQPTILETPSSTNSTNPHSRHLPTVSTSWTNEPIRQWGSSGGAPLARASTGLGTSMQSSQTASTVGLDLNNWLELQFENPLSVQGTGNLFDAGDLGPF